MENNYLPKISVITVTYNAEKYLEKTIDSVIEQSYSNLEFIIVDGNSTDNTVNILSDYMNVIDVVIRELDRGLYDAMNKGISKASGDYLVFLNAGDVFHSLTTIEQLIRTIPFGVQPDVIYGNTAIVNYAGEFLHMRRLQPPKELTWKSFSKGMLVCHQSFFAKRELVEPYNLEYKFSSDFDWCIRILKKSSFIHNSNLILVDYLEEGLTTKNRKASLLERFRIMVKHYGLTRTLINHVGFIFRLFLK